MRVTARRVRLWAFGIATAIGVAVLLLLEVGLRLFGYGYASAFTVPCTVPGPPRVLRQQPVHLAVLPAGRVPAALRFRDPCREVTRDLPHFRRRRVGGPG